MEIISVQEYLPHKAASVELAGLVARQQAKSERRRELEAILAHHQNPRRYHLPPGLAAVDPRDARRERDALDRALEDLERSIETHRRAVEQAASEASEKILTEERPAYRALVAAVDRARQSLVAAEAARMAFLRDLERRGVRTGGLTAEG